MFMDDKKQALVRALIGGLAGLALWVLVSWVTQPGSLFLSRLGFDFTFYYGSLLPDPVGAVLSGVLWFAFGAETALATLPFADEGKALLARSLCHFAVMMATVVLWAFVNFFNGHYPLSFFRYELWYFLVPVALVYVLVWLGRWVGWYAEVAQIRQRLGLAPRPSLLKWQETLPHILFAGVLCLLVPTILRLCDPVEVPLLSELLYPFLLLPIGGLCSACSLGKRQGFCPLYPLACLLFTLLFLLTARLYSHIVNGSQLLLSIALLSSLAGNLLGAGMRRWRMGESIGHD